MQWGWLVTLVSVAVNTQEVLVYRCWRFCMFYLLLATVSMTTAVQMCMFPDVCVAHSSLRGKRHLFYMLYYHWHDPIATETHRNHLDTGKICTCCITTGMTWSPQRPTETHRNHLDTGEICTRCITTGMTWSPQRPTEITWTLVKSTHAVLPLAWPDRHRDPQKSPGHRWNLHTLYYHWHDLFATETHRNHLDTGENCTRFITTGMTWSPQRPTETTWTLVKTAHDVLPLAWPDRHRDPQKPPGHWWKLHRCITTGMTWSPQRPTETTWTLVKTAHAVLPLAWPVHHRDSQKPPGYWWKLQMNFWFMLTDRKIVPCIKLQ